MTVQTQNTDISAPHEWWLISADDVDVVRRALEQAGMEHALHILDTGLHTTDAIPTDFQEPQCKTE